MKESEKEKAKSAGAQKNTQGRKAWKKEKKKGKERSNLSTHEWIAKRTLKVDGGKGKHEQNP